MSAGHPMELETLLGDYPLDQAYDEMREGNGALRAPYRALAETLAGLPSDELQRRKQSADLSFFTQGITFTVAVQVEVSETAPALDQKMPIPEDWSVQVERAQQVPAPGIPFVDLQQVQQQQQQ